MVDQRTMIRADHLSDLVDVINRVVDNLQARSWSIIVLRPDTASPALDIDNVQGWHLYLGSGIMSVKDTGVEIGASLALLSGNALLFWNAANTNSANLKHSGTNDVLKSDDGLWLLKALNVGPAIVATTDGDVSVQTALNVGPNDVATGAGEVSVQAGFNVGANRVVTDQGRASIQKALNVGADSAATDVGDAHFTGGIFVGATGSFVNPSTGQIITTVSVTTGQLISQIATGTQPINVTSTTVCTNLNADMVDGFHAGNSSGQVPVSNGTVNANLNADLLDGRNGLTRLLNYVESTDVASSTAISATTWTAINSNQTFTVANANSTVGISVRGVINMACATGACSYGSRIMVDSAGSATTYPIGGGRGAVANEVVNALEGSGTVWITGLSAASHTVRVEVYSTAASTAFCRCSTQPNTEHLQIQVVEQ